MFNWKCFIWGIFRYNRRTEKDLIVLETYIAVIFQSLIDSLCFVEPRVKGEPEQQLYCYSWFSFERLYNNIALWCTSIYKITFCLILETVFWILSTTAQDQSPVAADAQETGISAEWKVQQCSRDGKLDFPRARNHEIEARKNFARSLTRAPF